MNLDDFSTVVDEQRYINPQVSLDEQNAFIDNLRSTQSARNAEIAQDTYNLGTAVPSNLGGLSGAGGYFNARYQTPQTNTIVGDLRAAAQAQALNTALSNELNQAKQRYNNAYKAAAKRAGYTTPGNTPGGDESDDGVYFEGTGGVDPNGLDTVTKHTTKGVTNPSSFNTVKEMTGGGSLPTTGSSKYYLVSPNGSIKTAFTITKSIAGTAIDTPMFSASGKDYITNYLSGKIKQGYRVQLPGGQDISSTYRITMGL